MKAYQVVFKTVTAGAGYDGEETGFTLATSVAQAHDKAVGKLNIWCNGKKRVSIKAVVEVGRGI